MFLAGNTGRKPGEASASGDPCDPRIQDDVLGIRFEMHLVTAVSEGYHKPSPCPRPRWPSKRLLEPSLALIKFDGKERNADPDGHTGPCSNEMKSKCQTLF